MVGIGHAGARVSVRGRLLSLAVIAGTWATATVFFGGEATPFADVVAFTAMMVAIQLGLSWQGQRSPSVGTLAFETSQHWLAAGGAFLGALVLRQLIVIDISVAALGIAALATAVAWSIVLEILALQPATKTRRAVVIGTGEEAAEWIELVEAHPEMCVDIVGCIGDLDFACKVGIDQHWLGTIDDTLDILERENIDMPIVSVTSFRRPALHAIVNQLVSAGHDVGMSWGVGRLSSARLAHQTFSHETVPMIRAHRPSLVAIQAKRLIDVTIASVLLVVTSPVLLLAACIVRLDSPGPSFFRQKRVGINTGTFELIKLRTMRRDAADELDQLRGENQRHGPLFKMDSDPRVTRVGALLRDTSLDELPQLVNVLRGEMSLVGPRPALPEETEQFDSELLGRCSVRPGITGLWQLEARSNQSFSAYKRLDLHYVENWSLMLDLRITIATAQMLTIGAAVRMVTGFFTTDDDTPTSTDDEDIIDLTDGKHVSPQDVSSQDVAILGAGYVGLTQAVCLAHLGHRVHCADINEARIAELQAGLVPILEDGLENLLGQGITSGLLTFTTDPVAAASAADYVFLCVPTPQADNGSADLRYLQAASEQIARHLRPGAVVINKSTVPVGSAEQVQGWLGRSDVHVVSNPEFLREGTAIADWLTPDRILVGGAPEPSQRVMDLYASLPGERVLCDTASAELIKYASNAYLATRLTFVNSVSELCEHLGADAQQVTQAMGLDKRIGPRYLQPGPGWGGSCFPKDTHALAHQADRAGVDFRQLRATIDANEEHYERAARMILDAAPVTSQPVVAALGLAFKAGTDDTRESPALKIIDRLLAMGAVVQAYDPGVVSPPREQIEIAPTAIDATRGADVLAVLTEWPEFGELDLEKVSEMMVSPSVVDLRNMLDPVELNDHGFRHAIIGRSPSCDLRLTAT